MSDARKPKDPLTPTERPPRPPRALPNSLVIPTALRERDQWVCWRYEWNGTKWTKVPVDAATGHKASSTNPASWTTFAAAMERVGRDTKLDGVGFVLTEDDEFAGVDLDECIDGAGAIAASAREVIDAFGSYTEISPSGLGVKVFLRGAKPSAAGCKSKTIKGYRETEVYDRRQFFTVTGQHLAGTPTEVMERQDELNALCAKLWPRKPVVPRPRGGGSEGFIGDDEALIEKARRATNGVLFSALWGGDTSHHGGDDSSADLALCNMLAFWTGKDADRMDRLFRGSGLMRDKWDKKRSETTYGRMTIDKAIAGCREAYSRGKREEPPLSHDEIVTHQRDERETMTLEERSRLKSDIGNAARLVMRYGEEIRFCYSTGCWHCWDGTRWRLDDVGRIDALCMQTALAIIDEARSTADDGGEALRKWSQTSQHRERLKAMRELAKPEVAIRADEFDTGKDLLNCKNGTVDLRTGELREHRREDLITKLVPVEFDLDAKCPLFMQFLRDIAGQDESLEGFLKRFLGYGLTGHAIEPILPIFHGDGGNGKSVLLDTVSGVMGDYACEAPPQLLIIRKRSEHPTEIADLQGRRLVVASENEEGAELNLPLVKLLTGNQSIKARRMRQDFFEFNRTHKLVLLTNKLPILREKSEAVRRRIRVVPFSVIIPEDQQDPRLLERLLEERSGILAWLVRGAVEWATDGLCSCEAVTRASADYVGSISGVEGFFDDVCEFDQGVETVTSKIMAAHVRWSQRQGRDPVSPKELAKGLLRRNCVPGKRREQRVWRGVSLKQECERTDRTDRTPKTT